MYIKILPENLSYRRNRHFSTLIHTYIKNIKEKRIPNLKLHHTALQYDANTYRAYKIDKILPEEKWFWENWNHSIQRIPISLILLHFPTLSFDIAFFFHFIFPLHSWKMWKWKGIIRNTIESERVKSSKHNFPSGKNLFGSVPNQSYYAESKDTFFISWTNWLTESLLCWKGNLCSGWKIFFTFILLRVFLTSSPLLL